jgi:hypothetical protein
LNWHVGWLFALEDAVDVAGGTPELVDEIRSVGNQAAAGGINAVVIDRGQSMPRCERDNQLAMDDGGRATGDDQATVRALRERSTPSDEAEPWSAPNWAGPAAIAVSRRTATRVTPGAISLSSSSHLPAIPYSKLVKPVALPPGRP